MSIRQNERGAVHVMFVIGTLLFTLIFASMWFVQMQDNDLLRISEAKARAELKPVQDELEFAKKYYEAAAKLVGGAIPAVMTIPEEVRRGEPITASDVLAPVIRKYLNDVREICRAAGDPGSTPNNGREAVDILKGRYESAVSDTAVANQQIAALKAENEAGKTALAAANKRAQDDLAALNTEKDNSVARLTQQTNDLTGERDALQTKNREVNDEVQKIRETTNSTVVDETNKRKDLEGVVKTINSSLRIEQETVKSDGKILAVNRKMRTLYLDLGSKDFLRRGTSFQVYETVKGAEKVLKGRIVVTSVEADRSEARIDVELDGQRIQEGDWIFNPYFERGKTMRFAFLGEMNGSLSRELATSMLRAVGAKVDDAVSITTNFLVLGMKDSPEAVELTDTKVYKDAQLWGVEVIRSSDLESFLKP